MSEPKVPFVDKTLKSGNKVRIPLLPAISKGIPIAKRLMSIIAPVLGGAFDGIKHDDFIHGAPTSFTQMAMTLVTQADKAEIEKILLTLLEGVEINGKPINLDDYFRANYGELVEIVQISLKENFGSFFTGNDISQKVISTIKKMMLVDPLQEQTQQESSDE